MPSKHTFWAGSSDVLLGDDDSIIAMGLPLDNGRIVLSAAEIESEHRRLDKEDRGGWVLQCHAEA